MAVIPGLVAERNVIHQQVDAKLFHAAAYTFGYPLVDIPMAVLETVIFGSIVYWLVGMCPPGIRHHGGAEGCLEQAHSAKSLQLMLLLLCKSLHFPFVIFGHL